MTLRRAVEAAKQLAKELKDEPLPEIESTQTLLAIVHL